MTAIPASTTAKKAKAKDEGKESIDDRWGKTNTAAGWTALPNVLFQRQRALGLDSVDLNIILHLAGNWWDADRFPFPSVEGLAAAVGVSARTIQRHMKELETWGYIKRKARTKKGRRTTNVYDLSGLVKACEPFSQEVLDDREQRAREKAARATRKRPKMRLVSTTK